MRFALLGPVRVSDGDGDVSIGGPKRRAVLAALLLAANEVVSRDRLIELVWGEHAPVSAGHTLDDHVSRLRKSLGPQRLETQRPGYRLLVAPGELDIHVFENLLREGREALGRDDPVVAFERLERALRTWRGAALADLLFEPIGEAEADALEERRLLATEERNDAALRLGQDARLLPELECLTRENPFRERLLAQFALALYRAGRQSEALAVLQAARQRFAAELGLELAPAQRDLERRILVHDPSLLAERVSAAPVKPAQRGRRRRVLAGVVAAAAAAGATAALALHDEGRDPRHDPSSPQVLAVRGGPDVAVRGAPSAMAAEGRSLWVADASAGTVSRLDLTVGAIVQTHALGGSPGAIAVGDGSVWVADAPGATVTRIDRTTESVTQTIRLDGARIAAMAFADRRLWVADAGENRLVEIDAARGVVRRTIDLDVRPSAIAVRGGAIWIADYDAHAVVEVDARSGQPLVTVNVGKGPVAIAAERDGVWVANALDSTVSRIDPSDGTVVATTVVGSGPVALASGPGAVWVASEHARTVMQLDTARNAVVSTHRLGAVPTAIANVEGRPFVGVRPGPAPTGGRLVLARRTPLRVDPALAGLDSPFQSTGLVYDGLVAFNHAGGPSGLQIVPDLAIDLPSPADGGRAYTFRLRPRIRFSDGRPVRAADFRRGLERSFTLRAPDRDLFDAIAGAQSCLRRARGSCDLSAGIVADEATRTITFRLTRPDPQFLVKLTNGGFAIPVPAGTPMRRDDRGTIPGTGPYRVAAADRRHIRYVRNLRFREWSHAAQPAGQPDEIVWRFGLTPAKQVRMVEQGHADWAGDPIPGNRLAELRLRRPGQLRSYPWTDTEFLQLNTRVAPFDDVRVRRALNLAIDRARMVAIHGGAASATATCQLLPPGVLGFRRYCPYTRAIRRGGGWKGPDLGRARRLVARSGTRGAAVAVWGWRDDAFAPPSVVRHVADVLRRLGYRPHVRLVTHAFLGEAPARVFTRIAVIPSGWSDVTAYGFFAPWLSCRGATNHGNFCDPRLDRRMRRSDSLEAARPRAAARSWARLDRELVDRAPLVPLVNLRQTDFLSARVDNVQHHPYLGLLVDQLRVR